MKAPFFLSVLLAGCSAAETDRAALKEELKHEILAELREPSPERAPDPAAGHVQGRVMMKNEGVAGCRVRLVRVLVSENFLGMYEEVRRGVEFIAVTDASGRYVFRDVPCGPYRLLWQPPGDSGWIRRLQAKPDVLVEAGKSSTARDIDLTRRPVGAATP